MYKDGISLTNDAKIIAAARSFAAKHPDDTVIFVTNDLLCRHIASMYFTVEKVDEEEYDYDGYKEVYLTDSEMAQFYSNPNDNTYELCVNQYLLIYEKNSGECVD
jgi:predicted ribonuclease YlaK